MVSVHHTHDAELANRIANQDGVREFFHTQGLPVDLTPAVAPPSTQTGIVALTDGDDALALFEMNLPGIYQSHTLFGPRCRGRKAIETGRAMVQFMFDHGARTVWGSTPRSNLKAIIFNSAIGAKRCETTDETDVIYEIRKEDYN
jgi:hypothetical protein